ncbi:ATP-grasp domain-containing protein [Ornithinimicrobium faecis]|uniref:ATP-grasp domain-containing protein n=1 Tax=Ornithinimicrobium faecis TaxID=2934158 RepID=A0ABY4YYN2_9MICO|nr:MULTISPECIES: hypothetical protein [unclassified Ornithinimicrobium]USQ81893.1 hypothetical protein NF556_09720 [Ornithinimicrobium sp. HY1793]
MSHVAFLLGKAPKVSTIFPEVFDRLAGAGVDTSVHLPHDETIDHDVVASADLVVQRGLNAAAMESVADLHVAGAALINSYAGVLGLVDRVAMLRALEGLPVPATTVVDSWPEVAAAAGERRCVVKSAGGPGRGQSIVVGTADELRIDRGLEPPFLVQDYVMAGEFDHKLYLVGDQVRGLLKPSPLAVGHTTEGAVFTPDTSLVTLARAVRERLDLDFLGVDVLVSEHGPVVVDVNDFPGYRGVDDAAELVAAHLLERLERAA